MADTYRPEQVRALQRDHRRESSWRKETSPPRRLPTGTRSNTMDPRPWPSADPRKRIPSRSPEGSASRKQLKQNSPRDARRSSLPSDSMRSPSTGAIPPAAHPPEAPVSAASKDGVVDANHGPIVELLTKFSSHVTGYAAMQIALDQAKIQYDRAQLEYDGSRRQFDVFPAIKERKTADKAAAHEELQTKEAKLNAQRMSHTEAIAAVAQLIAQATKQRTDVVSRAEFESLVTERNALRSEVHSTTSLLKGLRDEIQEARKVADGVVRVSEKITALQRDVNSIESSITTLTEKEKKTANLASRVQNKLDTFMSGEAKKFATQEQVIGINAKHVKQAEEVSSIREKYEGLYRDISQMKADKIVSALAKSNTAANDKSRDDMAKLLKEDVPALKREVEELQREHHTLATLTRGESAATADSKDGGLSGDIRRLKTQYDKIQQSISPLLAAVPEIPQDMLVKRIEKLERFRDDLKDLTQSKLGDDSENQDVIPHEQQGVNRATAHIESIVGGRNGSTQPQIGTVSVIALAAFNERLREIEVRVRGMDEEADIKDGILEDFVNNQLAPIKDDLAKLSAGHAQVDTHMSTNEELKAVERRVDAAVQSLADKVSSQSFNDFSAHMQKSVNALDDGHAKLHGLYQQLKNKVNSPSPPLAPVQPHAATIPNGVGGSVMMNGPHPPRHVLVSNGNPTQPPVNYSAEIAGLNNRCDGLIHATNHLKQRFDNLTTDDVARSMVDQMSAMYPDAKNFQRAIDDSQRRDQQITAQLGRLQQDIQQDKDSMTKDIQQIQAGLEESSTIAKAASAKASETSEIQTQASIGMQNVIDDLKAEIGRLSDMMKDVSMASADAIAQATQLENLRADLDTVSAIAYAANELSRGHDTRLNSLDLEEIRAKQEGDSKRIDQHEEMVEKGKKEFEDVNKRISEVLGQVLENEGAIGALDHVVPQLKSKINELKTRVDQLQTHSRF